MASVSGLLGRTALLLGLLLSTSIGAQQAPRRVVVLPFQAISGDVPARAGPRVTQRLATEVRGVTGLELAEPPETEPPPDALAQAREAVKSAQARRQQRDFVGAEALLGQALGTYATSAVAAALPSGSEVANAYALLAAVRYSQGRDEDAERALASALSLSPGRALPLAATSPLFARTVERVRVSLQAQPRGSLRFDSVPPGVPLTIDGHALENTPIRVTEVPPGAHLWRAELPSGENTGGLVEALSGKEVEIRIHPPGEGLEAALASALAGNRLDTAALDAAVTLGQAVRADLVLFGTVARTGSGLAVDAFLVTPGTRTLRRLPRLVLDTELLEAGPPLRELASTLASRGPQAGEALSLPATASAGASPASSVARVKYPAEEKLPSTPKPATPSPNRAPLAPRKPLVRP